MIPYLVQADAQGRIREHKHLSMLINRCGRLTLPERHELMPLPRESELFLLPGRMALGRDSRAGRIVQGTGLAVAAFAAPGYTLSAHPAYAQDAGAPLLPLFAYGAVGYANGRFWIAAQKVDVDKRQCFAHLKPGMIEREAEKLLRKHGRNRLVCHIVNNCVRRYACPAARNFALGRYEAPLPTSRSCPARCIGCISLQDNDSPIETTPQCRLTFTPAAEEITEVMRIHESREHDAPIYSFGQGCEGDPLANGPLLARAIAAFRAGGGRGTVNCNTNASDPGAVALLAESGLTSLRVSLNSARPDMYRAYYRPANYDFAAVEESIRTARRAGVYVSLNLLYFPGLTDTEDELVALASLCRRSGVDMIQLRNLNIDPAWYPGRLGLTAESIPPSLGLQDFINRLQAACPWLRFGYFNPYLGDKGEIRAPMPV